MEKQKINENAIQVFSFYGRFFKFVAEEFGMLKALELQAKAGRESGVELGTWMKNQMNIEELDSETLIEVLTKINVPFSYGTVFERAPENTIKRTQLCPWYQGFQIAGFDHKQRNDLSEFFLRAFFEGLKEVYTNIEYNLSFAEGENGLCTETIRIS
jgi:hypothetical protein